MITELHEAVMALAVVIVGVVALLLVLACLSRQAAQPTDANGNDTEQTK